MFSRIKNTYQACLDNLGLFMRLVVFVYIGTLVLLVFVGAYSELPIKPHDSTIIAETVKASSETIASAKEVIDVEPYALPTHISIPSIGVDTNISNPTTNDTDSFDKALLKGAVRYPGSALLGENANVFLFGHSTSFKVVRNQAYKAFNNIGKLKEGDEIYVSSEEREYIYRVISVSEMRESEAIVGFGTGTKMLTLSTCNVLGEKEDRFIVRAEFVKNYSRSGSVASNQ